MDARCSLLVVLCTRLALAAGSERTAIVNDTGGLVSPPASVTFEAKKVAFADHIKSSLQKSNEEYAGSAGEGSEARNRSASARRRAPPLTLLRPGQQAPPPAPGHRHPPALPRDHVRQQEEETKLYLIQQSREDEGPGVQEVQVQEVHPGDIKKEAQERRTILVDIEREEMAEEQKNAIPVEEIKGKRQEIKPVRQNGNFGRGEELQMETEQEQALLGSDEGKREREARMVGVGQPEREGQIVGVSSTEREGSMAEGKELERDGKEVPIIPDDSLAQVPDAPDDSLVPAPGASDDNLVPAPGASDDSLVPPISVLDSEATTTRTSKHAATKRVRAQTVARASRGVRMTMQEIVDNEEQSKAREGPAEIENEERGAADLGAERGGAVGEGDSVKVDGDREGEKQAKVEKLRSFLRNNKDVLKKFILEKRKQRKLATSFPTLRAHDFNPAAAAPATAPSPIYTPMTFHPPRAVRVGVLTAARQRDSNTGEVKGAGSVAGAAGEGAGGHVAVRLLSAHHLDMAPALGSRVISMRSRGRLCQRNVLMPEGPKYDSKGAVYLLAYNRSRYGGRDYSVTKSPQLLLPACCNCCKKSVLGCE